MEAQPSAGAVVVGRDAERRAIDAWLEAGRPASLLINGEAGIGKSTLWAYAADRAADRGDRVLAWRASNAEHELAFAALTALFDEPMVVPLLDRLPDPRRRALETAIGRVSPDLDRPEPSLVGLAVADVLRILSAEGPVVVAIDDVQWTDAASAEALAFAARRLRTEPVGFVLALRTGPDVSGEADLLSSAVERSERLHVGPLSVGALGRLVHERLDVAHPRPLLVRLHEACSGNPFLGLGISRSLQARGMEPALGEPFPVPPQAEPVVRDHLATLSRDARRSVVIVAMSPSPSVALVERVLREGGGRAVDEACEKGVLVADGSRLRAVHPLFTSTAYADAPPGERRALRAALADIAEDPVERAIHQAAMVAGPDADVAEALAAAGRTAFARGAPAIAADLLERSAHHAVGVEQRSIALIAAADAAVAAGDYDRAATSLRAVLDAVPHGRRRAEALLALGEVVYLEDPNEALVLLVSALDHTDGDPLLEALVHSHIAGMADMDPGTAQRSALAAVDILERPGLKPVQDHLACALLDRAFHWLLACEKVAVDDIDRAIALRSGSGVSFVSRRAQEVAHRCSYHLGRLDDAIALDQAEYRRLTDLGQVGLLPPIIQSLTALLLMTGDWEAARQYARECHDLVEQGEEAWRERSLTIDAHVAALSGDLETSRAIGMEALTRQEATGDLWEGTIFCAILGFVELSASDHVAALRYLTRALEQADAIEVALPSQFGFLGDLVEAAVLSGEIDLAEQVLHDRLEEPATRVPLPWILAMAARGRGLVAAGRGELDDALGHLDRAEELFRATLGMPFERARTLLARGQVHRRAGQRRKAREDIGAALETFQALGAAAWAARARQELGRIGGRTTSGSALTESERAVAELAAAGRSNREIAAELVVSVRTVESQLSAAYRKLDIQSRGQLTAALAVSGGPTAG
ncbi:MAG TPA: AAA family ATPase [Candidatus Limnocylindria bacterium]|nr:AAA family ATPase [Candidatus Limnocylindria bacterium]